MMWQRTKFNDTWITAEYITSDEYFKATITCILKEYSYEIRFNDPLLDDNVIVNSIHNSVRFKKLSDARIEAEKILSILNYVMEDQKNRLWIFKGVMLGFKDISEMEHLKETFKP